MKLTIVSQYFPPETGAPQARWFDLARRFVRRGHDVQVLTALPNYPGREIHADYVGRQNTIEWIDGIRIARVNIHVPTERTFADRIRCYLSFALNARRYGPELLLPADVLVMESPPLSVALAALPLARRVARRLVVNVSDLWPDTAVQLGLLGPGPLLTASRWLERRMYQRADLITAQTDGIADDIRRRLPHKEVALFPNGVDLSAYENLDDRALTRHEFGWSPDTFVVGYTGVIGHAQALDQVLDAAAMLKDAPVHFAMFGDGPTRGPLESRIAERGLHHAIRLYPRQATSKMPRIQSAFDAGIVPLANAAILEGARPSKMFEIMAAGCPMILCARGEAEAIVRRNPDRPAALVTPPEEPSVLAASIRRLLSAPDLRRSLAEAARDLVRTAFNRETIAADIEVLFERLAASPGRAS